MHPLWNAKRGLLLYLLSWGVAGVLLALMVTFRGELLWWEGAVLLIAPSVVFGFMCLAIWYLCQAFPLERHPPARILTVFLAASAMTTGVWVVLCNGWATLLVSVGGLSERTPDLLSREWVQLYVAGNILFLLAAAVHYILSASQRAGEAARQVLEHRVVARDAELKALRGQLDPHFLFNSLNSISALTSADPAAARGMVLKLAGFIRATLAHGNREEVPLAEELQLVSDYLEIERSRFGSRMTVELDASPEVRRCLVPPLILQPLVENAVKHGVAHWLTPGVVRIQAIRNGADLRIRVENPVEQMPKSGRGLGLDLVRRRLALLYGGRGSLKLEQPPGSFTAVVSIPAAEIH